MDDSISTTPESAIAALKTYGGRFITIVLGGFDRGIGYTTLVSEIIQGAAGAVICIGDSGSRIYEELV